ncbi:MAG: cupredoxin domain-containing protein [Ilumatobacteraceae bacterium]
MKTFHRRICLTIATGLTAALLLGCGSSSSNGSENTDAPSGVGIYGKTEDVTVAPTASTSQISIEGSSFSVTGDVKSSDVVSITNHDSFKHTVTADDGAFDVEVSGGTTESLPALTPGVYSFHCKIHSSMKGSLTVV